MAGCAGLRAISFSLVFSMTWLTSAATTTTVVFAASRRDSHSLASTVLPGTSAAGGRKQIDNHGSQHMAKLTKRVVDAAENRAGEYFLWDEDLPGFGLRVLPSGRKRYIIQYRAGRRSRRISLGPATVLTCEQARSRAITIIAATKNGEDPAARRDAGRRAITIKELAERFEKEHIGLRLKPSTAKGYKRMLERFVIPRLGNHRVNEVTRADIAQLHHELRHIAYDANRCLEMISKMFNLAEMWGLRPDGSNPRKHIKKYPEEKRERFLSRAELKRVGEVLREMEQEGIELPSPIAAARLLMLTGCRLGEIMTLQWEHVDIAGKALRLAGFKDWREGRASRSASSRSAGEDRACRREPMGNRGDETGCPAHGPSAVLATGASARRTQGRAHP